MKDIPKYLAYTAIGFFICGTVIGVSETICETILQAQLNSYED